MATYAIGDIQGCDDELAALLDKLRFNADRDRLWFCGDLVNRGPQSLEVLRRLYALRDNIVVVLGNHDLHLLATAFDHRHPGKKDTLDAILDAPDAGPLLDWLRRCPLLHHDPELNLLMVHAGLHPAWSLQTAISLAREMEAVLQGPKHIDFYRHMYGDKPHNWSDTLSGWLRYRFITNIFTRLRFCRPDGQPALNAKGPPGSQDDGYLPWYAIQGRKTADIPVIFGHWSTLPEAGKGFLHNTLPLDTGCLWGGRLTAVRLDDGGYAISQINCPGAQRPGDWQ